MAVEVAKRITARQGNLRAAFSLLDTRHQEWIDGATMIALFLAIGRYRWYVVSVLLPFWSSFLLQSHTLQVYSFMASNLVLWLLCQKDRMICLTVSFWDVGTYLMFGHVQADFFLPSTNEETSRFGLMSLRSYVMWLPKRLSGSRNWLASRDVVATQTCILWNIPFMHMSSGLLHCPLYQSPLLHLMYVSHNFVFFWLSRHIL